MPVSHAGRGLHNVPAEVTSFVGRRSQLAEVKRLLSTTRLLTLTGPGGVGKTRLALHAARELERAFPDGIWLVELAALRDPALLTQVVSTGFGLRDQSTRWEIATLNEFLSDKHLLLVLDNCEHLVDACAILAEGVLHACPEVRIMATSRQPLGIRGEATMTVPSLSLPDGGLPRADDLLAFEAIGLFAERAAAAVPGFVVSSTNQHDVIRLCRHLDGVPLAIELAAVRLKVLGVGQIMDRLHDRFKLLTVGNRAAVPRHQTLEATIQWSYDLLSGAEKTLWLRLAVFAGSFGVEAVEEVCTGHGIERSEVFDLVAGLLDKSIVMRQEVDGRVRYRMLESIREFGLDRLQESGDERSWRRRHRDWIGTLLGDDGDWLGVNQRARFDRLELEHDNLRTALDFCLNEPGEAERGLVMAAYLWPYWQGRGHLREGRRWIDALLAQVPPSATARGRGLAAAGNLALMHGDLRAAMSLLEEGRAAGVRDGDTVVTSFCLTYLGLARMFQGDLDEAASLLEEALKAERAADQPSAVATSLGMLAMTRLLQGNRRDAIDFWHESRAISLQIGDQWILSYTLWGLGIALWMEGESSRAAAVEKEALQLKLDLDERLGIALCLETLAWIVMSGGDPGRAARLLGAARATWDATGASLFEAFRGHHHQCETDCRKALRGGFETAFRKGLEMSLSDAVADALEERRESQPPKAPAPATTSLSPRERQIAQLVATGLTNREIAAKLVLSERTAETHVQNILNKLGFRSRSEIAAWAAGPDATVAAGIGGGTGPRDH